MSVQSEIDRINNNVQTTLQTIADTGVNIAANANSDALPAAAAALANEKQNKLTGTAGQVVGFDAEGNAVAQEAPSGGGGVQPDWNQNDANQPNFIKNKPFGETDTVFIDTQTVTLENGEGATTATSVPPIGSTVTVEWDGVEYECIAADFNGASLVGNASAVGADDTGEPFAVVFVSTEMVFVVSLDGKTSVNVKVQGSQVVQLDRKYYSGLKVFFAISNASETPYLYTDAALTTKATASEVANAIKTFGIAVCVDNVYYNFAVEGLIAGGYASVGVLILSTSSTEPILRKVYYSAEYVPPTT